jgi:uncharacterized protein YkwD
MELVIIVIVIMVIVGKYFMDSRVKYQKPSPISNQKEITYDHSIIELETMSIINDYRVSVGLIPLKISGYVSYISEKHTTYMINGNFTNHNGFVDRQEDLVSTLGAKRVGENVAYNYSTAKGVLNGWLNSPTHKENIIGSYTHFGISIKPNLDGKKYYTNIFIKI